MNRINLKKIMEKFFTLKSIDDKNRPHLIEEKLENYNNGSWSVE